MPPKATSNPLFGQFKAVLGAVLEPVKKNGRHVVMFSGGVASWCAARRVADAHGTENLTLLFADTKQEDEDLYRFLGDVEKDIGIPITKIAEGRNPWQVFNDERFLGNSRVDLCSRILKREILDAWRDENLNPERDSIYVGYDWTEQHRIDKLLTYVSPWVYKFPLADPPLMDKAAQLKACRDRGIRIPRLYDLGFQHNNCGGFCVKGGQASFRLLLKTMPERYAYHEEQEQALREKLGKNVSILKHRSGPLKDQPWTLREFREHVEAEGKVDLFDWGACSCLSKPG